MADKNVQVERNEALERARGFWARYSKTIIYVGSFVILLAGAFLIYKHWFKMPKEERANEAIFAMQKTFSELGNAPDDSTRKLLATQVLNGEGNTLGAIKVMDKFSGTEAANLSHFYAGAAYLHLKQFDKAVKYLDDFSTSSKQIQSRAYGMMGDAYAELKKNDEALKYYRKAANENPKDEYNSPEFLFRAALFAETIGKDKDAIELYKKLKDEYPNSLHAGDVDKYLARLGELN